MFTTTTHPPTRTAPPPGRSRRLLGVLVAAALVAAGIGIPAAAAQAEPVLLSQGKTVTASSTESADYTPASAAVDGNAGTRWASTAVRRAVADRRPGGDRAGRARSCSPGRRPTGPGTRSGRRTTARPGRASTRRPPARVARRRWTSPAAAGTCSCSAPSAPPATATRSGRCRSTAPPAGRSRRRARAARPTSRRARPRPRRRPSRARAPRPASRSTATPAPRPRPSTATANTRWASQFSDAQWIQVDLGATATVDRVELRWEAAYGKAFQVQLSPNGTTWTTVATVTNGTGGNQTVAASGTGRYLRLNLTARGTGYGYSLWDLAVLRHGWRDARLRTPRSRCRRPRRAPTRP